MKISETFNTPSVRILLYVYEEGDVRYSELAKLISSRGTLSSSLKELDEEGLLERKVETTKPIKAYYMVTPLGKKAAESLKNIKSLLS